MSIWCMRAVWDSRFHFHWVSQLYLGGYRYDIDLENSFAVEKLRELSRKLWRANLLKKFNHMSHTRITVPWYRLVGPCVCRSPWKPFIFTVISQGPFWSFLSSRGASCFICHCHIFIELNLHKKRIKYTYTSFMLRIDDCCADFQPLKIMRIQNNENVYLRNSRNDWVRVWL